MSTAAPPDAEALAELLIAQPAPGALHALLDGLPPEQGLATIAALKAHVDAVKLRNAGRALAIAPGGPAAGYGIEGQILGPDGPQPGGVRLSGAGVERAATVDELGFFAFDDVAPGAYTLALELAAASVIAETLEVP